MRSNDELANAVAGAAIAAGVRLVFISPGSRSTPLVAAFARAERAGQVELQLVLDERSSAFAAVGAARSGWRAAVVTTSGTAVANLLPALCEADRDELALVAITADRPAAEVARGANQTVDQPPLLASPSRAVLDLCAEKLEPNDLSAALAQLDGPSPGPVHLNVRFAKPLEPAPDAAAPQAIAGEPSLPKSKAPRAHFDDSKNGLVVVGALPHSARAHVDRFLRKLRWPALVDLTSGLDRDLPERFVPALLRAEAARAWLDPDRVLWIGGRLTEPAVAAWLKGRDVRQWRFGEAVRDPDGLFQHSTLVSSSAALPDPIDAPASQLGLAELAGRFPSPERQLTEPWVARTVAESARAGEHLFVGNSMPIRDVDRFARKLPANLVANRGVSGIDGNLATCFGAWRATREPVTALLGDLAFLHDAGSLALLAENSAAVRLVCVNNAGGGIFHFLPVAADRDLFEPWFSAPHARDLIQIARGFGLAAASVESPEHLEQLTGSPPTGPELLEIRTDRAANAELHAELDRRYAEALR